MKDSRSLLGILGVVFAIVGLTVGHYHDPWAPATSGSLEDDEMESPPGGIRAVSGPIEEDLSGSWPWAHHIDFDERFPGEDQIAEESETRDQQQTEKSRQSRPQWEQRLPPMDDLVIPDFARMFSEGPQIGRPTERPRINPTPSALQPVGTDEFSDHPWWDLFGMAPNTWWKGPNVCVKREEDESQSSEESADNSYSFKVQYSMCTQQNTRFVCASRQQNPETKKLVTLRSEYECCHGFALDERRTKCVKGGHENILTTIEQIGGTEFVRLIRMVGLESKLKTQNLTVFLPSNEALVEYIRTHNLESSSIQLIPQAPAPETLVRARRSILMHTRNEAGGRNVRRRGGESKGRQVMMSRVEMGDDIYPTDASSSSEEDREQDTDDVVRIPVVKRSDPTVGKVRSDEDRLLNGVETHHGPYYGLEGSNKGELEQMLLNQMLAGKLSTDDFIDEKVVFTENVNEQANEIETLDASVGESHSHPSQGTVLRLNTWFINPMGPMYTVNCVPLTSMDNKCSNGVVHVVSDVFKPATQSLGDILANNPQLSVFRSYLHAAGLLPMLEKSDSHLTLLAPTNAAMESMSPSILSRMRVGDSCLKKILRRHILPITLCSAVIQKEAGKIKVRNMDLDIMEIERNKHGKVFINGSEIIETDSVATNGVLHVVDKVLVSDTDKTLTEILRQDGFGTFVTLMYRAGINLNDMENITVFAPSHNALLEIINEDTLLEPKRLEEVLKFHIVKEETSSCALTEKTTLPSILPERNLIVNTMTVPVWPLTPRIIPVPVGQTTVQCINIGNKSGRGCNGRYHQVERVLNIPTSTVLGMIQESPRFTVFSRLLTETLNDTTLNLLQSSNVTWTIFAPTDAAFNAIGKSELQRLRTNKTHAMKVINRHIFREAVCCSEAAPQNNIFFRMLTTLDGSIVRNPMFRIVDIITQFGKGHIITCDTMGRNGILHIVDTVSIGEGANEKNCRDCNQHRQAQFLEILNLGR